MIDCNITKNYLKEKKRMCENNSCSTCPLTKSFPKGTVCIHTEYTNLDKAIKIVQKWSNEHPQKTFLTDFLEKYPNVPLAKNGFPSICPYELVYTKEPYAGCGTRTCKQCWNRPIEDNN